MYSREKIVATMQEITKESNVIEPYVVIAQPRRNIAETPAQNFDAYTGSHIDMTGFSHGFLNIGGEKVDVARNYLFERALESGAKYMLFIGEDTVVPYYAFKKLLKTAEENPDAVVTGVYYIKCLDPMIMVRDGNWIVIPNVDPGQVIDAWQTGMDIMMIPIKILKEMKEENPDLPFCCIWNKNDPDEEIPFVGEDNFFVHRLHKRGTKLLVNTDVQCLHMDLASGMYTAHPSVNLKDYFTNIPITRPLTLDDKDFIDRRWTDRLPEGTGGSAGYKAVIARMIEEGQTIRFNMGCGRDKLDGYMGVDMYSDAADIKQDIMKLDLPEGCADEIFASHVIEHIPQHRAEDVLDKWLKTLKEGGKFVMETPNLELLCRDFINQEGEDKRTTTMCIFGSAVDKVTPEVLEKGSPSPHLWGYTPETLTDLCVQVGFKDIRILPQTGQHPGKNFRLEATK